MNDSMLPQLLDVHWPDLVDAHQASVFAESDYCPCLRLDTSEVLDAELLGQEELARLMAQGKLLYLPSKSVMACLEQRRAFATTLCDPNLRRRINDALAAANPFLAFDAALELVPIEAERWREEERHQDLRTLEAWLLQQGVFPEPRPSLTRTIIEFPVRRELVELVTDLPDIDPSGDSSA
jgi:hypothetical protein